MPQSAILFSRVGVLKVELPSEDVALLPGVRWGAIDAFPTPAYWVYQAISRRMEGGPLRYRLGRSLAEEVGACLLGGHGIRATVGLAAYERLRLSGAFERASIPSEEQIRYWLNEPLSVGGRPVRYRFAAQKARYLARCMSAVHAAPTFATGRELRDWLVSLPGIGPKTASWISRNWMDADDVAILDVHIIRFGIAIGLFDKSLRVEKHYAKLEALFLDFCNRVGVRASELDAVIWHEMASSPASVRALSTKPLTPIAIRHRTRKSATNPLQIELV